MSNSSASSDWKSIALVRQFHLTLHLDSSLKPVSNDFGITDGSFWNDYSRSLLPVPVIILSLGLLSISLLLIGLCCRCCFKSCRCINLKDEDSLKSVSLLSTLNLTRGFMIFMALTILANQALFIGNNFLTSGVDSADSALNVLDSDVSELNSYGTSLETSGNVMLSELQASTCPDVSSYGIIGYVEQYLTEVNSYISYVSPLPDPISNAEVNITYD